MVRLLWDASGLAKRYIPETGDATVLALWQGVPLRQMTATFTGYAETYSILLRKFRRNELSASTLAVARTLLESETIHSLDFTLLSVDVPDILSGIPFMETHSLNSSDAAILASFLRFASTIDETCVLVAADERLLKAAAAEGLKTLNPELIPVEDVPGFLAL